MTKCALPGCKKQARRKFCSNKHKDRFHNLNNPRGHYAHLADRAKLSDADHYNNTLHPQDPDALGQWND